MTHAINSNTSLLSTNYIYEERDKTGKIRNEKKQINKNEVGKKNKQIKIEENED